MVDGGDGFRVGEVGLVGLGRKLARQCGQRQQLAAVDCVCHEVPVGRGVALGQVHRQPLVDPARGESIGVADSGVEDEVDELVRDDDPHPAVVDRVRRDQGEQGPDVGVRLAADVLPGSGTERGPERGLVAVDEEVDAVGLGHAQQVRRVPDCRVADLERLSGEGLAAVVPVDRHEVALEALPVLVRVAVADGQRLGEDGRIGSRGQRGPGDLQPGIGDQVSTARGVESVGQRLAARSGRRDLLDERSEAARIAQPDLHSLERSADGDRDGEGDALAVGDLRVRLSEGRERSIVGEREVDGSCRCRSRQQERGHGHERREQPREAPSPATRRRHAAHGVEPQARPASRRMPVPLVDAPSRPSRTSENDVP